MPFLPGCLPGCSSPARTECGPSKLPARPSLQCCPARLGARHGRCLLPPPRLLRLLRPRLCRRWQLPHPAQSPRLPRSAAVGAMPTSMLLSSGAAVAACSTALERKHGRHVLQARSSSPPTAPCRWGRGLPCPPAGSGCPGRTPPRPWRLERSCGVRLAGGAVTGGSGERGGERRQGRGGRLLRLRRSEASGDRRDAAERRASCLGAQPVKSGLERGLG